MIMTGEQSEEEWRWGGGVSPAVGRRCEREAIGVVVAVVAGHVVHVVRMLLFACCS
eukprot:CAMPEP_0172302232 /NCGR_PEP_ID=MMETSP1058-20130122/3979_1 /TAXON_ID=83371 /ORGANISM="Detonula confervacea, Strain CCMP 353" /LENGTH=55 /DNA_ID=CAMNT_0013012643 /DNA_START=256 /DNA_END=419 /DNA_ORIENTATION=-